MSGRNKQGVGFWIQGWRILVFVSICPHYLSWMIRQILIAILFVPAMALGQDCRMNESDLKPVILEFNPFFTDHTWDEQDKAEVARLDDFRLLTIRQKACLRHHILITMLIEPTEITDENRFWITEMLVMLKRVFYGDPEYMKFKRQFEVEFIKFFLVNGTNTLFNFPLGERSFICKVEHGPWGARIKIEIVRFIFKERIRRPGIPREQDDGWFLETVIEEPVPDINQNQW